MMTTLELESTLTDRYQTTVPGAVRRALKLGKRDRIRYMVQDDGLVILTRAVPEEESDPVLQGFLRFLVRDISANPQHVQGIDVGLASHIQSLVADVEIDLHAPLAPEDE